MKKKIIPAVVVIALIIIVIAVAGGISSFELFEKVGYSKEYRDLSSYYKISNAGEVAIVLQDERIGTKARLIEGTYYLDYDSVGELLNDGFYIDEHENLLIYTTANSIIQNPIGTNQYFISGEEVTTDYPISVRQGDTLYLALDYVKKYCNFSYEAFTGPDRIQLKTEWGDIKTATIKKNTWVRYQGGVKSDILRDLEKGEEVIILEELEEWDKIKTSDAIIGYVEKKRLDGIQSKSEIPVKDYEEPEFTRIEKPYTINMAWHAIYAASGNDTFDSMVNGTGTMSIIAPTWYSITGGDGDYTSFASADYVERAHARNMEVWAVLDNINNADANTYELMSYTSKRTELISKLMEEAKTIGFDGYNLDFELLPSEAVPHYVQFIKELSVACRRNGLVLSVDNYSPRGGANYGLKWQGKFIDYVVIMGYDEHWGTGGVAGSVASIGFVEEGIKMVMDQGVPADKIVNGIPFYTRVWKTVGSEVESEALGMVAAKEFCDKYSLPMEWRADACQYYGEKTMGGTLYQIWLEDTSSIEAKLSVMKTLGVAGVAEWQLGQEDKAVWDVIDGYVKSE